MAKKSVITGEYVVSVLDNGAIERIDDMLEQAKHVFGFVGVSKAIACEKNIDTILNVVKEYLPEKLKGYRF